MKITDQMIKNDTTYAIISDHLGSVRLVVNTTTGEIEQRIDYDEFGVVLLNSYEDFQPFGYAGGLSDSHTKIVRFGVRDYDTQVGRWTARDPILFGGGASNLYEYCLNDPINYVDITGYQYIPFSYTQPAYLPSEGVGLHGTYRVAGAINIQQNPFNNTKVLSITASGYTAANQAGNVKFTGKVQLLTDDDCKTKELTDPGLPGISDPNSQFIGTTDFILPNNGSISIRITAGYTFKGDEGFIMTPVPPTIERIIKIR